jgi:hypothetical protein
MLAFLEAHQPLVWTVAGSIALGHIAAVAAAHVLVRLPPDYFQKPHTSHGPWRIATNISGWFLLIAGLAMLALPGPGMVVLLLGVVMADFPGKARVQRWLLSRGPILKPANWLRARFDKPPLKAPKKTDSDKGAKPIPSQA